MGYAALALRAVLLSAVVGAAEADGRALFGRARSSPALQGGAREMHLKCRVLHLL